MSRNEHFRQLFERGVDAVWVTDAAAVVAYVSPAAAQLLGAAAPAPGTSVLDAAHAGDRGFLAADLAGLLARPGSFVSVEYRIASGIASGMASGPASGLLGGDGCFRWIESTVANLLADPAVGALVWSQRDVAGGGARASSPAAEGRLADILARVSDGILALDRGWRVTYANASAGRVLGVGAAELVGRDLWERLPQLAGTPLETHLRRAMAAAIAVQFEAPGPAAERWLEVDAFPTAEGLSLVARDVTVRRRSAAELARLAADLEERLGELTTALSVAPVGIAVARDPECREVAADARFAALLGLGDGNLIAARSSGEPGIHFDVLQRGRTVPLAERPLPLAAATGRPVPAAEYDVRRPDGEVIHLVVGASPLFDAAGRVRGAVAACVDVTERKRAEDEVRAAKRAADEAIRARTRLLAALSHELRTPLTPALAILARIEATGAAPAALRTDLERVRRSIEIEARLIDDLLDLTGLERGEIALRRETVELARVIEQAIAAAAAAFAERRVLLRADLAAGGPVDADAARLAQAFWALLDHALRETPAGSAIALRTARQGGEVVAELTAAEAGVRPEDLTDLFAGLGDETLPGIRPRGSAALTLAVAAAIVERHGGTLAAASARPPSPENPPPAGARRQADGFIFTVRLPLAPAAALPPPPKPPLSASAGSAAPAAAARGPLNILLVEDHADTAGAMAELLQLDGHRVTVAASVAAARRAAAAAAAARSDGGGLDLVISDLGLPDGSGHQLMEELAAQGIAGIALSGFGAPEDRDASRRAGFRLHLTKPIDLRALRDAIRAVREGVAEKR